MSGAVSQRRRLHALAGSLGSSRLGRRVQERYPGSMAEAFATRLRNLQFVTTITLFGSAFLLSALPFMILVSSFANRRIESDLSAHLGLDSRAAPIVGGLFRTPTVHSTSAMALAVAFTLAGTLGVATTVRGIYEQVFGRRHRRGGFARLCLWIAALCGWFALDSVLSTATGQLPGGHLLDALGVLTGATLFFWWSMHLLLEGQLAWGSLLLPAVVTALFWLGLQFFSALYFSGTISNDSQLYGTVGVVFSLLTWFIAIAAVIVLGAVTGEIWQRQRGASRPLRASRASGAGDSPAPDEAGGPAP